ncbi:hypothetical protein Trydic_g8414 [Trypoxylus dichotomus]
MELEEFIHRHHLDANSYPSKSRLLRLSLPNYRVYRTEKDGARGGGTAILVKSSIYRHADLALELHNIEASQSTWQATRSNSSPCARRPTISYWKMPCRRFSTPGEQSLSPLISTQSTEPGIRG